MSETEFHDLFPHAHADTTPWKKLSAEGVSSGSYKGERIVEWRRRLTQLAAQAMVDCQHLLRPGHLQQLRNIPDGDENDKCGQIGFELCADEKF